MEILINCLKGLGLAALHNFWLAEVYKIMNKSRRENYVMMQSMVFISVILAGAMMVIGNNLAVAFGLVGAVSIVRFRMNVGSIMDMSFIFLSIVIGMACGLGFYFIATVIAVFTGVLMICIHFSSFGKKFFQNSVELEITISFPRSTLENMPDKDQIMKAISESGDNEMNFLEYKSKSDMIEVVFRSVWQDITHVQKLEKILDAVSFILGEADEGGDGEGRGLLRRLAGRDVCRRLGQRVKLDAHPMLGGFQLHRSLGRRRAQQYGKQYPEQNLNFHHHTSPLPRVKS